MNNNSTQDVLCWKQRYIFLRGILSYHKIFDNITIIIIT